MQILAKFSLFAILFSASVAQACQENCVEANLGRIKVQFVIGDLVDQPADAWISPHPANSVNDEKSAGAAIYDLDKAPYLEYADILKAAGGRLPHGTVTIVKAGEGQLKKGGVKYIFHAVEWEAVRQILFLSAKELDASEFPFSEADRAKYRAHLVKHADILSQASQLISSKRLSTFNSMTSLGHSATPEERQIEKAFKPIWEELFKIVEPYDSLINMQTAFQVTTQSLTEADGLEGVSVIGAPAFGSGFWGGMGLGDSMLSVLIALTRYQALHPEGKPLTFKFDIYARSTRENILEVVKIMQKKFADLDRWDQFVKMNQSGAWAADWNMLKSTYVNSLLANMKTDLGERVILSIKKAEAALAEPKKAGAEKPAKKSLFARICEALLGSN